MHHKCTYGYAICWRFWVKWPAAEMLGIWRGPLIAWFFFCSFSASSIHMWHTHFAHVDQCLKFNPSAMFSFGLCTTQCIMLFLFILSFFLVVVPHCSLSSNTRNVQRSLSFYSCVECHIWAKICSDFNYWHIARCSWTTYTTFVCEQWIYRLNERQLVRRFALYET